MSPRNLSCPAGSRPVCVFVVDAGEVGELSPREISLNDPLGHLEVGNKQQTSIVPDPMLPPSQMPSPVKLKRLVHAALKSVAFVQIRWRGRAPPSA